MSEHEADNPIESEDMLADDSPAESDDSLESRIESAVADARANDLPFDELTLSQLVAMFLRAPRRTWGAFASVVRPRRSNASAPDQPLTVSALQPEKALELRDIDQHAAVLSARPRNLIGDRRQLQLGLYIAALMLAWWASASLRTVATEGTGFMVSIGLMILAFFLWLIGMAAGNWADLQQWWQNRDGWLLPELVTRAIVGVIALIGLSFLFDSMDEPVSEVDRILNMVGPGLALLVGAGLVWLLLDAIFARLRWSASKRKREEEKPDAATEGPATLQLPWYMRIHPARVLLLVGGIGFSGLVWFDTDGNSFQTLTFYLWLASIIMIALAISPDMWGVWRWLKRLMTDIGHFHWRKHGLALLAFVVIMVIGVHMRLQDLHELPAEMTSDHVELLLDAVKVLNGERDIFFANNGGREPVQMYLMALLSLAPGLGINHNTLKLLAAFESILTIPLMIWLGRELAGPDRRRLGWYIGFVLAVLLATSYWHLTITRQALRIVLMPLQMSLVLIFLIRAVRYNTRADYILTGLMLGFGLYMYQAMRMVPVLIVMVVLLAAYLRGRTLGDWFRYGVNLVILALVSLVVFLPMLHYSVEQPEQFWRRTAGRILGDDVIQEVAEDGSIQMREPSIAERVDAFSQNVPQLMSNTRNVLMMFHIRGDGAWINGVPGTPALSTHAAALFILGLAACLALALKTRDPAYAMLPIIVLVMLLPSSLSIAFPNENPSNTRSSGAMPAALLIAALPLGLFIERTLQSQARRIGVLLAAGFTLLVVVGSYLETHDVYFGLMPDSYEISTFNYSEVGQIMYGQALSGDVPYGNMFMIASPHWWDHRAVGLDAGIEGIWPNGVYDYDGTDDLTRSVDYLPHFIRDALMRSDRFAFDPNSDIEIFYNATDEVTANQLQAWFPQGRVTYYDSPHERRKFYRFTIPALGLDAVNAFLTENLPFSPSG
ncbi:MAG: hypothetical protein CL607_05460 [Anaerolineaceae bacterium]|nr:hypothetical protein [Anaerolineaceae bacterium]